MTYAATTQGGRFDPGWLGWLAMAGQRHHHGRHRHGGRARLPVRRPVGLRTRWPHGSRRGGRARRGDVRAGDSRPARRGAAQRLPAHAGDRATERGRLGAHPGLGLPGAPAARGRRTRSASRRHNSRKLFHLTNNGQAAAGGPPGAGEAAPWDAGQRLRRHRDVWELFRQVAKQVGMAIVQLAPGRHARGRSRRPAEVLNKRAPLALRHPRR